MVSIFGIPLKGIQCLLTQNVDLLGTGICMAPIIYADKWDAYINDQQEVAVLYFFNWVVCNLLGS